MVQQNFPYFIGENAQTYQEYNSNQSAVFYQGDYSSNGNVLFEQNRYPYQNEEQMRNEASQAAAKEWHEKRIQQLEKLKKDEELKNQWKQEEVNRMKNLLIQINYELQWRENEAKFFWQKQEVDNWRCYLDLVNRVMIRLSLQ